MQPLIALSNFSLAQTALPPGTASTPINSAITVNSIWDFVLKGGPVMIPIGVCSLVALAVIFERLVNLRRRRVIPPDFLAGLRPLIAHQPIRLDRVRDYCTARPSPLSTIIAQAVKHIDDSPERLEKHIQDAGEREIVRLRKYLRLLSVIASIATLLGLLGTILGMIEAFQTVAASGEALGKTELLAKGIYEALITTAAGLMVSIPVLIAYHAFAAKVDALVLEMDQLTVDFLADVAHPRTPATQAVHAPPYSLLPPGTAPVAADLSHSPESLAAGPIPAAL